MTDSWFSHEVVRANEPFHASGLPPDFVPNWDEMGIDRTATPSFDEVADVRAGRQAILRELAGRGDGRRPGPSDGIAR